MANPHRGEVEIDIGGTRRTLRFNLNSMAEIQEELKLERVVDLWTVFTRGFKEIRYALFAGLKTSTPELTLEQVGEWVVGPGVHLNTVIEALDKAFTLFLRGTTEPPKVEDKGSGEPSAPASA